MVVRCRKTFLPECDNAFVEPEGSKNFQCSFILLDVNVDVSILLITMEEDEISMNRFKVKFSSSKNLRENLIE